MCNQLTLYSMNQSPVDPQVQLLLLQALLARRDESNRNEVYLSQTELEVLLQIPRTSIELAVQRGKLKLINSTPQYSYNAVLSAIEMRELEPLVTKQTAIQETILQPLRAYNDLAVVAPKSELRTIYALEAFSLPEGKILEISLHELNGGRTLTFTVDNKDLVRARAIDDLELRF